VAFADARSVHQRQKSKRHLFLNEQVAFLFYSFVQRQLKSDLGQSTSDIGLLLHDRHLFRQPHAVGSHLVDVGSGRQPRRVKRHLVITGGKILVDQSCHFGAEHVVDFHRRQAGLGN
jgi:hypothetical protein